MKGVVIEKPGSLVLADNIPMPELNEYQVLTEQLACGLCTGTDTKILRGVMKGEKHYPCVLGHESVGRVIEMGKKVKNFALGDLVLRTGLGPVMPGPGLYSCNGAFAEYGYAADWRAMAEDGLTSQEQGFYKKYLSQQTIPQDMDPVDGTMVITFKEVLSAARRFGFGQNDSLLVFGQGPVGLCFVRMAKLLGLGPVVACDVNDARLEAARRMGADYCFNSREISPVQWAKEHMPEKFDYVLDAVGINDLMNTGLELLKFNGKMCVYGISPVTQHQVDWNEAPYNFQIHFLQWPTMEEESACHTQVMSWIQCGALPPGEFYSHVLPMSDIMKGYELLWSGQAFKVIIDLKK